MRRAFAVLLHLEDTPHRTALAFGLGVFVAFFPVWGIHTLMAIGLAVGLRLNRLAVVLGAWVNNPWTMAPLYAAGTALGCALLGMPMDGFRGVPWSLGGLACLRSLSLCLRAYLWPFVLGNLILGCLAGAAAYVLVRGALQRRTQATAETA
jgi:uncharacterized protein (DUF2062 family)